MLEIINAFVSCTIFTITLYIYGIFLFEKNSNNNRLFKFLIFLILCLIHTYVFICATGTIKTILICIIYSIVLNQMFNINILKSIFSSIIFVILLIVPDLITLVFATTILGFSKEFCYSTLAGGIISNISVSLIMILITFLLRNTLKKLINYSLSTSKKIIFVSIMTLITLAIFFYSLISIFEFSDNIAGYVIVIITLIAILFYLFKQKVDNDVILKKYDDLLNIMKTYESDIEEQRTMIHETRNELMTIKSKINDKEKETAIIKYIDSIIGDKVNTKMSKYSKFTYLPSNGIKGFFYYKFMEAEKREINVSVNISKRIENSFLGKLKTNDFKDLVRIIGVYLDNAIEASSESEDKKLGIEIYVVKDDIEIIISNTFKNKPDIERIGIDKFTTKGKNRGHGLLLVKHILNRSSVFESDNKIINDLYVQKLKIKNRKDTNLL